VISGQASPALTGRRASCYLSDVPSNIANSWNRSERSLLGRLTSPDRIQDFLDNVPYSADPIYRSPRSVMRDRKAHCFDGALFAACALRQIGQRPRLIDLGAVRDDDHVIALFERDGHLGAIAKSNFVGIRFREPVFRSVRELALSYFESYYNVDGEKTLRSFSVPLDLTAFDELDWMQSDFGLSVIADRLSSIRHYSMLTPKLERALVRVDERSYKAGLLGVNEAGLYRPGG
jgi:hypothetical protein